MPKHSRLSSPPTTASAHRHADRWEQAKKAGDDRGKSAASVESTVRESAKVAQGGASAQAAAVAALAGAPPLPPGVFGGGDGGERGGARGGEAAPCRLEGRVEEWKPPTTADLRSSYRWTDEQKVTKNMLAGVCTSCRQRGYCSGAQTTDRLPSLVRCSLCLVGTGSGGFGFV